MGESDDPHLYSVLHYKQLCTVDEGTEWSPFGLCPGEAGGALLPYPALPGTPGSVRLWLRST